MEKSKLKIGAQDQNCTGVYKICSRAHYYFATWALAARNGFEPLFPESKSCGAPISRPGNKLFII